MKAIDLAKVIENIAPLDIQEPWDNSGFSVGNINQELNAVYVALDCSLETVEDAIKCGSNMIITHHPLIFPNINSVLSDNKIGKIIELAIKNDIVIYSSHTPMDKVIGGVSWKMAERLNLKEVETLSPENELNQGLGVIGNLPEDMTCQDFIANVKKTFQVKQLKCSKPLLKKIRRVAMCGGSGASFISDALIQKADVLVTGDIKYHDFYVDDKIFLVDIGHYEGEIDIVETIFGIVRKKFPTFAVYKAQENKNLVYYY